MSDLASGIFENVYVGLIGAVIAWVLQRALREYQKMRLNRRYPIGGLYVAYFEDEMNGQKYVATSEIEIHQSGLSFNAVNSIRGGKSWNLEGRIINKGYLAGAYLADSPYDPGNGTFFLKIAGLDLEGLWSGYDSVNGSITGGRYWFKKMVKVNIVDYQDKYRTSVLSVADAVLGAGYLNDLSDGDGFHDTKTLLALDGNRVLGFITYSIEAENYLSSSAKLNRVKFAPDVRSSDKRGFLGHIRIVGVDPSAQGRGIGSLLIEQAEQRLMAMGAQSIVVFGWTSPSGTHIGGILKRLSYIEMDRVTGFWTEESKELGYSCAVCGNPCLCDVIAFKKATMA